jgi:hypothetical protein
MKIRRIVREALREADDSTPVQAAGADIDMTKTLDSVLTLARWDKLSAGFKLVSLNIKGKMSPAAYVKKNTTSYACNLYNDKIYTVIFGLTGDVPESSALLYLADSTGENVATAKKKSSSSGVDVYMIENFTTDVPEGGETQYYIAANVIRKKPGLIGFEMMEKDLPVGDELDINSPFKKKK